MAKQTVVRPNGIVTKPNEFGEIPPGTLSIGDGIRIRRASIIEPRNSFMFLGNLEESGVYNRVVKLWPRRPFPSLTLPERFEAAMANMFVIAEDRTTGDKRLFNHEFGGSTTEVLQANGQSYSFSRNKAHFSITRNRTVFTSNTSPSITTPTGGVRPAGLPPLLVYDISPDSGDNADNWGIDKFIGYAAVLKYTDPDGYEIQGPVLGKLAAQNTTGTLRMPYVAVSWSPDAYIPPGAVIEFYRAPQQDTLTLLGDDYKLAFEYPLTAADLAAHHVIVQDFIPDSGLSANLYTNQAQDGPTKVNLMPPQSRDVFTFKKATFYVSERLNQQLVVTMPATWGLLDTPEKRTYGFGRRPVTHIGSGTTQISINPAESQGLKVGQRVFDAGGTLRGIITLVEFGGMLVTLDRAHGLSPGEPVNIDDVISVTNSTATTEIVAPWPGVFVEKMGQALYGNPRWPTVFTSPTVQEGFSQPVTSVELTFQQTSSDAGPFGVSATNGQNFSPQLPAPGVGDPLSSKNDPQTNRIHFSKENEPEHVPPDNTFLVGSGAIIKLWATQDSLFVFCTDGIFRIDGDGDDWSVKPLDPDVVLLSADAVDSMDNAIYAFTNVGLVTVTDKDSVQKITANIFHDDYQRLWQGEGLEHAYASIACDRPNHEAWVNFRYDDGYIATYIWNSLTRTLVTQSAEQAETFAYSPVSQTVISAVGSDLRQVDSFNWMDSDVEFNSVYVDDVGLLKQWIDVTLFFDNRAHDAFFLPWFNDQFYPDGYKLGPFPLEHVVAPVLGATNEKHCRFRYQFRRWPDNVETPYYQLKGLTYRYRMAAEPLGR